MLDARLDQAAGLRRAFRRHATELPLIGADRYPELAAGLSAAAARARLVLRRIDDAQIVDGIALPSPSAVLLAGCNPDEVADAYARLKVLARGARIDSAIAFFATQHDARSARSAHGRLAGAAARFLHLRVEWGGAAPAPEQRGGWRTLAGAIGEWIGERDSPQQVSF